MNELTEKLKTAVSGRRQPKCGHCGEPLEVVQTRIENSYWRWSEPKKQYMKEDDNRDADAPVCIVCGEANWDFVDGDAQEAEYEKLGLTF